MSRYGNANRYDDPRSLDFGTGTPAARDQWRASSAASAMWKSNDPNKSPINWLLARQQPNLYQEPAQPAAVGSRLLDLPWELRELILRYALPRTILYQPEVAWNRGSVAILRACRQLCEEGVDVLYSCNTFRLDVLYDCSFFSMLWLQPMRDPSRVLHVRRQRPFPECLSKGNVQRIRNLEVTVNHVDSYTGMIKYGYGGGGLTEGLKTQVAFLCQTLRQLPVIETLEICYQCQDYRDKGYTQLVLDPFLTLKNVRSVKTSGHVLEDTAARLKSELSNAYLQALGASKSEHEEEPEMKSKRPPNLEVNVKKGLALYRGFDSRDI